MVSATQESMVRPRLHVLDFIVAVALALGFVYVTFFHRWYKYNGEFLALLIPGVIHLVIRRGR